MDTIKIKFELEGKRRTLTAIVKDVRRLESSELSKSSANQCDDIVHSGSGWYELCFLNSDTHMGFNIVANVVKDYLTSQLSPYILEVWAPNDDQDPYYRIPFSLLINGTKCKPYG